MWNKLSSVFLLTSSFFIAQHCDHQLQAYVYDIDTQYPLSNVEVYANELNQTFVTDSTGFFRIENSCTPTLHLTLQHSQCSTLKSFVNLNENPQEFYLNHTAGQLNTVVVSAEDHNSVATIQSISLKEIEDNASKNLATILQDIPGVRVLKNGNQIAKPIVNGMYGNRLTILNDGIAQSGQQWGNDHSPEIDPLVANKIEVIKGSSSLEYQGANLGNIILVKPGAIDKDPHTHGNFNYQFNTNGRGHNLHVKAQQKTESFGWRVQGSAQRSGDSKAPNYYLTNTGHTNQSLSIKLEKKINPHWDMEGFASSYYSELGILRGSQIGNLTDLEEAFNRAEPFFTSNRFSYSVQAPRQKVSHQFFKVLSENNFNNGQTIQTQIAWQLDNRKEFDVRRGDRSNIPALSLRQYNFYADTKYIKEWQNKWELHTGLQYNFVNNYNQPETFILPLIPNYNSYEPAAFVVLHKSKNKTNWEGGVRVDYFTQKVARISNSFPREVIRNENNFLNISTSVGVEWVFNPKWKLKLNAGYTNRNPAINELYSSGLHQGVSGIEEGDPNLNTEKSIKGIATLSFSKLDKLNFQLISYYQNVKDYIFLNPTGQYRLTIRGAFPLYQYQQANARIYGTDFNAKYDFAKNWYIKGQFSYLKGDNLSDKTPLVYMPANNARFDLAYRKPLPFSIGNLKLQNLETSMGYLFVAQQNHLNANQDFVAPPKAYSLLEAQLSFDIFQPDVHWRFVIKAENLLDVAYRDYLNRLRYFADDTGRNISLGVQLYF